MPTTIIWTGKLYNSTEHCTWTKTKSGHQISSIIIGNLENQIYKIAYQIVTSKRWDILTATIHSQANEIHRTSCVEKKNGQCFLNGKSKAYLKDIQYIDISLSPFTNTLPINRLNLKIKEKTVIDVLYFDILENEIMPVKQFYTRLSADQDLFETDDKSFKAKITVDQHGLVVDYPKLFKMTAKNESNRRN